VKETFDMFPDPMFGVFFVLFFIAVAVSIILTIVRAAKAGGNAWPATSESQAPVREREIIREVVKIRCPYCGNLYDETEDKCPNCGGNRT
jgi:hypothetical protein